MPASSRLEARITIPTGGWGGTINDSGAGGAIAWTVPAGTYYMSELLAALWSALNTAATTDTIYVQVGNGAGGTGRITISGSATFAITWVAPEIRDLLGYTADLSGAASYLAPTHARALWLSDCPYNAPNEIYPWGGWPETDLRSVESASGLCWVYVGQKKETTWLEWSNVRRTRASKANESLVGESFQRFLEDGIWGFAAWGQPGGPIRFYPDADGTAYAEYLVVGLRDFSPGQVVDGWAGGPWNVRLPRLVLQSIGDLVPRDGPSSVYVQESALHFIALGQPVADFLFLCQQPSGNLLPAIGDPAVQLANTGGGVWGASVTGWSRKFAGTTDGAPGQRFATVHAALDLADGESYAVVALASMNSASSYRVLVAQSNLNSIRLNPDNTLLSVHADGTTSIILPGNYDDSSVVHPLVWLRDCATGISGCRSDLSQGNATHGQTAQVGKYRGFGAGSTGENSATTRVGWYAIYKGKNAENRDWKAYLQRQRWPLSY